MLFSNKEEFKDNEQVYKLLTALEVAHTKQDEFAISVIYTRLTNMGIKFEKTVDTDGQPVVQ